MNPGALQTIPTSHWSVKHSAYIFSRACGMPHSKRKQIGRIFQCPFPPEKAGKGSHQGLNSDPCCQAESWVCVRAGCRGWVGRDMCICLQLPRDPVSIWQEQASVGYGWFSGMTWAIWGNRSILQCKALPGNSPELLFTTFPRSPTSPAHAGARLAGWDGSVWCHCACYRRKTPCKWWLGCHRGCCLSPALVLSLSSKEGNLRAHAGESSKLDKLINTTPGTLSSLSFERKAHRWESIWSHWICAILRLTWMNSRGEPGAAGFHSSRGAVGGEEGKPSPGTREKGEQCAKYSGVFTAGRTWLLQLHLCRGYAWDARWWVSPCWCSHLPHIYISSPISLHCVCTH